MGAGGEKLGGEGDGSVWRWSGHELFLACEKASPVTPLIPLSIPVLSLPNIGNGQMLVFR